MEQATLQRLRETDILGIAQYYHIPLTQRGPRYWAVCPLDSHTFQEKTPSFVISPHTNTYHCFGCKAHGDVFSLVGAMNNTDSFPEQVQLLSDIVGISIEHISPGERAAYHRKQELYVVLESAAALYEQALQENRDALAYFLVDRQITRDSIKRFRLGYAPRDPSFLQQHLHADLDLLIAANLVKERSGMCQDMFQDRYMFPIVDRFGKHVVGFAGRRTDDHDPSIPKYVNTEKTPVYTKGDLLYGLAQAQHPVRHDKGLRAQKLVIPVEGYTDVILAHQHGIENVVGQCGTALTDQQARLLSRLGVSVALCLDADPAGISSATKDGEKLLHYGVTPNVIAIPGNPLVSFDPADFLAEFGGESFVRMTKANTQSLFSFKLEHLVNETNLDEPEQKHHVIGKMLSLMSAPRDPTLRWLYVEEVARRVGTTPKIVCDALMRYQQANAHEPLLHTDVPLSYEHQLLHILFHWPALRNVLPAAFSPDHFSTRELGMTYSFLAQAQDIPQDVEDVMHGRDDGQPTLFHHGVTSSLLDRITSFASERDVPLDPHALSSHLSDIIFLSLPYPVELEGVEHLAKMIHARYYDVRIADVQENILTGLDPLSHLKQLLSLRRERNSLFPQAHKSI